MREISDAGPGSGGASAVLLLVETILSFWAVVLDL